MLKVNDFVSFKGHTKRTIFGTLTKMFEKRGMQFCIIRDMQGTTHIQRLHNVKEVQE